MKNPRPTPIISRNEQGPTDYITMKLRVARFAALCTAWSCFWVGHWTSKLMDVAPIFAFLYPIYNTLMYWSCTLSDNYDLGIWRKNDN